MKKIYSILLSVATFTGYSQTCDTSLYYQGGKLMADYYQTFCFLPNLTPTHTIDIDTNGDFVKSPLLSLTTTGTGAASYNASTRVLNIPTPTVASKTFNNAPNRTIQTVAASANGWQVSSTKDANVSYSASINTSVSLSGNSSGYLVLEICPTNSSTAANWIEISRCASGQSGTLVVGLVLNQVGGGCLNGVVPAGYYVRIRSVNVAGTPTFTSSGQQEVY